MCCGRSKQSAKQVGAVNPHTNRPVKITAGPHKNKTGKIVKQTRPGVYSVKLDSGPTLEFYANFLKFLD